MAETAPVLADDATEEAVEAPSKRARPPIHVPLALALVGGVTLLILVAVGSVLLITLIGATENTFSLLGQRSSTSLDLLESRISSQLEPIEVVGTDLGAQFADGRLVRYIPRRFRGTAASYRGAVHPRRGRGPAHDGSRGLRHRGPAQSTRSAAPTLGA